jgi:hypothetical protein
MFTRAVLIVALLLPVLFASYPPSATADTTLTTCPTSFGKNLSLGMTHPDVKYLQQILNADSATRVATKGEGSLGKEGTYFGLKTFTAVVRFQEKYTSEILKPSGLTRGSGFVGFGTRAKLLGLCKTAPTPAATPTPSTPIPEVGVAKPLPASDPSTPVVITPMAPVVTITQQPSSQTVAQGQNVSFDVVATTNVGTLSYQWQRAPSTNMSFSDLAQATGTTFSGIAQTPPFFWKKLLSAAGSALGRVFSITSAKTADSGIYRVKVKAVNGALSTTVYSNPATLTVSPLGTPSAPVITITQQPLAQSVPQGASVTFTTAATSNVGTLTYRWEFAPLSNPSVFSSLSNATDATYRIASVSATREGYYRAVITSTNATAVSNLITNGVRLSVVIPDTQAPAIPSGLSASVSSPSQVNLSWTASADNAAVTEYRISRCQGTSCTPSTEFSSSATPGYAPRRIGTVCGLLMAQEMYLHRRPLRWY